MVRQSQNPLDFDLFLRLWDRERMSAPVVRQVLKLGFSDEDRERAAELAEAHREGELPPNDLQELDSYVRVGTLLSALQSRARKVLRQRATAR